MSRKEIQPKFVLPLVVVCLIFAHIHLVSSSSYNDAISICYSKNDGTLLQANDSCTSYSYCLNEKPITLTCPKGKGFSAKSGNCVKYSQSDCVENEESETPSVSTLENDNKVSSLDSTLDWLICYSKPDGTVISIADDCTSYIYCLSQFPLQVPCLFGMGFSSAVEGCVQYQYSDCVVTDITTIETPSYFETTTARGTCDNEIRAENKAACVGQAFGELVPYPGDCSKFLVCNCEYPTVKQCTGGTWFDNKLKVCNYPQNVECDNGGGATTASTTTTWTTTTKTTPTTTTSPTTTSTPTTTISDAEWGQDCVAPEGMSSDICFKYDNGFLLSYPYNCNAYINCTLGCPVMSYCQDDKVFNALLKICDTPETAHCEELPIPSTTTEEPTTTTAESKTTTTPTSTTMPTTTPPCTTCPPPTTTSTTSTTISDGEWGQDCVAPEGMLADICLKYDNGFLLRYPYNCNAYINCTLGCPVMTYCQKDKVFNAILKICDTPETAHCEELPIPSTTTTTEEPTTTTEESTTTTEVTTVIPDICLVPAGINKNICLNEPQGSLQPYPYNCTAYIVCRWECPYIEYCETNTFYNSLLGICDATGNVDCVEIPYPTPGTPTTTWPVTTTTGMPFSTTLPPGVEPEQCSGEPDYTVFPYAGNCGEYLICLKGQVEVKECPNGWLFNAQLMLCDDTGSEVCYTGITTSAPTATTTAEEIYDLCLDQLKGVSFPYPDDCQKYYYCRDNGTYFILSCPFNNYYDPNSGDCGPEVSPTACTVTMTTSTTTPATTTTLSPSEKCRNQNVGDTFPYEEDCAKYIYCTGYGTYVLLRCPSNNYYYPDTGECGPSADVDICRKGTTTTTSEPTTTTSSTTTVSTAAPLQGICGDKVHGELVQYPDNCLKYISCVRPIPVGFYCPNNWYFDVNTEKCVPDANGSCSELPSNVTTTVAPPTDICQGQKEGDWQIYPRDCQMYYECLGDGFYMLQICTQGEYFDPLRGQCSADVGSNYCKQDFDTTTTEQPTTPKPQGICSDKPDGSMVPYPQECNKYILCASPIPIGYNCTNGLEFSSEQQKCVEPCESDCGLLTTPTATTTTEEPTPTLPVTECTGKPDYTLFPYEEDCAMFIVCIKEVQHYAYCNEGQYFDLALGECSYEGYHDSCLINGTTTSTTTEITTTPSTTTSSTTTITTTTVDPNIGPCDGKPDGTKIPYPDNCEKYIVCHSPISVGYDCAEGLEFSAELKDCVQPELANCSIKTTTTEATTTTAATTTTKTEESCENMPNGSTLTYPSDCSKYYLCLNGKSFLTQCTPNTYYNPSSGQCDSTTATSCQETTTTEAATTTTTKIEGPCDDQANGYTYAYSQDCSKYYMCLNGTPFVTLCHPNTYYNPRTGECDEETSTTACKESDITTTQPTTITVQDTTTTEITTRTTPTTTESTTAGTPQADNICCGKKSGTRLPYPGDSTKYVICQYPLPEVSQCPADTEYDPSTEECKSDLALIDMPCCTAVAYGQALPYEGDCTKYYLCFGSKAMVMTCGNNWYFNGSLGSCVPSELYQCPW